MPIAPTTRPLSTRSCVIITSSMRWTPLFHASLPNTATKLTPLAASSKIRQFFEEHERKISWVARSPWVTRAVAPNHKRIEYLRLLQQYPAVTSIRYLDPSGLEQLLVSRLGMDAIGSQADLRLQLSWTVDIIGYSRQKKEELWNHCLLSVSSG